MFNSQPESKQICNLMGLRFTRVFMILSAAAVLGINTSAFATSSDVILDLDGNPGCKQLITNAQVIELRDNNPQDGENTISDANISIDYVAETNVQSVTTVTQWSLTQGEFPIIATIHKAKGSDGARVFHFGLQGVTGDSDEEGPGLLQSLAFCYSEDITFDPEELPQCDETANSEFEGVGITCPADGTQRDIFIRNKSEGGKPTDVCTCNYTVTECDESVPTGGVGACPTGEPLNATPTPIIIWDDAGPNSDDGYCLLRNGAWRCYN